ncbi:late competence protein ComER [Bacillus sonorensis]|uniref:Late competence protein ComER n=2 Tax=Bacillus sonorensis TaxID=119858 RepID=M5PEU3_9BACI|nr:MULTISPECIES: late competence protein ComER [Bacillus]TWK76213.1 Pyrroline-5-carboxylate reductase [Bacillus paralicheniformis]ASB88289.1 ComE operon protein [Bacillus sonorensis]EME74947.1 late competence protein ComER [Bacillus sonorensis L12]MBG9916145.1 competence protein [Bacillus sonorensis]MCY8025848.1 late competence protein ComER [Bacillus sonorensis]
MKIGFIGTGNMGTILIEALIESKAAIPSSLTITNRTIDKALNIKKRYPGIQVAERPEEAVSESEAVFICVKPHDIHPLLKRLAPVFTPDQILITITSPVQVEQLETIVPCQAARVIPSITNRALSGVSLLTFGESCKPETREKITDLMKKISIPLEIENGITRVASDIVSCGPAFISYLIQEFIQAAVEETSVSKEDAILMSKEMLVGLGRLLESELYTLPTLQKKVCVKGGVTGEGIKALESGVQDMFRQMFRNTHLKYEEDIAAVKKQFQV